MAIVRLFAGLMGGQPRVRASKPGFDASKSSTEPKNLQFDTNWNSGLTIHARGIVSKGTREFSFPALDYIPYVYLAATNSAGQSYWFGKDYDLPGADVTNSKVLLPGGRDRSTLIVVWRAQAFKTRNGTGHSTGKIPRLLIGHGGANVGGQYGIFISRPNYDVTKCNEGNILFSSSRNKPNIMFVGNKLIPVGAWGGGSSIGMTNIKLMPDPGYMPMMITRIWRQAQAMMTEPSNRYMNTPSGDIKAETIRCNVGFYRDKGTLKFSLGMNEPDQDNPKPLWVNIVAYDIPVK